MDVKSFKFYDNYYLLIRLLPKVEQEKMSLAIIEYMFEGKEPNFKENTGLYSVWVNILRALSTSKSQSLKVQKRYTEEDTEPSTEYATKEDTEKHTEDKTKRVTNNTFLFLISNFIFLKNRGLLRGKIEEWLKYKDERKEYYKETGFKSLMSQIEKKVNKYGEQQVIALIDECMASNYKGIIWDRLKNNQIEVEPSCLNQPTEKEEMSEEELKELEEEFREFR